MTATTMTRAEQALLRALDRAESAQRNAMTEADETFWTREVRRLQQQCDAFQREAEATA